MHDKILKKYYFINSFDTNIINKQDKTTTFIYRDYKSAKLDTNKILKINRFQDFEMGKIFFYKINSPRNKF